MRNNIQALRAVAAIIVVCFHVFFEMDATVWGGWPSSLFVPLGQSGVDLFFVISGFVMVFAQARKPKPFRAFMMARAIRILPMYWLITAVIVALMIAMPQLFRFNSFDPAKALVSFTLTNWLFMDGFPVLFVGWTLEYELLFYLLFGLSLAVLPLRWTPVPVGLALGLGVGSRFLDSAALEFVLGMLVGLAAIRWKTLPGAGLVLALGIAGLLATIPFGMPALRAVVWGGPAVMIVLGLVYLPQIRSGVMTWLGAASYSIYLIQVLAIPAATRLVAKLAGGLSPMSQALLIILITIMAGGLAYALIERPMGRWLSRRLMPVATVGRRVQDASRS